MALLIEADSSLPSQIHLAKSDVLLVRAFGVQIETGQHVVEVLGPLVSAVVQPSGQSLSPEGPPNSILFVARERGTAKVNVFFGDPWYSPQQVAFTILVE